MSEERSDEAMMLPDRYELAESPVYRFELARRDLFRLLGAGLLVIAIGGVAGALQESGRSRRGGQDVPQEIGAWLHIDEKGHVTVYTGKVEVGQNIRTSLTQVVAEELRVPISSVTLVMGDTALVPYDMGTFGSMTTRVMSPLLRRVAAAARQRLLATAATEWVVKPDTLTLANGKITQKQTGRATSIGAVAKGRKLTEIVPEDLEATPPSEWKTAGKSARKIDGRDFVTGAHRYASDIVRPGMLHGKVLRSESIGATLENADLGRASAVPGVTVVRDGGFVGVAAPSAHEAKRALDMVQANWKTTPTPSSEDLYGHLRRTADREQVVHAQGTIAPLSSDDVQVKQTFTIAYIAHVPLEPRAAVAEWSDGKLTVWTGTQRPFGVRSELAQAFGIPESAVRVVMPDTGSGYGGKHTGESAIEAARLAKAAGKPVKVVWTREEEFRGAYFRPAGVIDVAATARRDGKLLSWEHRNINSGAAGIRTSYDVPAQRIVFQPADAPLRQGSYRGLAATANQFARETCMDELASELKMDPLAFRLRNLTDERLRAVLEAAANAFGWSNWKGGTDRGRGIACGFEKNGYVATCAEIAYDRSKKAPRVTRVVTAFDCGAVVNPDHLRNQIEGALVQGLGGALFEAIRFEDGKIQNAALSRYRVPRFGDLPAIETVLVDRKDQPTAGAGETPLIALAPAIGSAIFEATGTRLRSLPMKMG